MDIDGGSGRAADAEVAERVMGWGWVVYRYEDPTHTYRQLQPPGIATQGEPWSPGGPEFVEEAYDEYPAFTTDPAADYLVLVKVRETWPYDRFEAFGEALRDIYQARMVDDYIRVPVRAKSAERGFRPTSIRHALYEPGDYSRAALSALSDRAASS